MFGRRRPRVLQPQLPDNVRLLDPVRSRADAWLLLNQELISREIKSPSQQLSQPGLLFELIILLDFDCPIGCEGNQFMTAGTIRNDDRPVNGALKVT
jgi:hypothetical protein